MVGSNTIHGFQMNLFDWAALQQTEEEYLELAMLQYPEISTRTLRVAKITAEKIAGSGYNPHNMELHAFAFEDVWPEQQYIFSYSISGDSDLRFQVLFI